MDKDGKVAVVLGLGVATAGVILATRAKAAPPPSPGDGAATIEIEIIGPDGQVLAFGGRAVALTPLTEGITYTVRLTITNRSTKSGTPWAASLVVGIAAGTDFTVLVAMQEKVESFSAGQTRIFNYSMSAPLGSGGQVGNITVWVDDPAGNPLGSATEDFTIAEVPIDYGADIVIGV